MECADACRKDFQMFTFGFQGGSRCYEGEKCECWCEFNTKDFKCKKKKYHDGYDLYAFKGNVRSGIEVEVYCTHINCSWSEINKLETLANIR